jgi:hypothetical protein
MHKLRPEPGLFNSFLAKAGLPSVYPTAEQYHADPSSEDTRIYTGDDQEGAP